MQLIVFLTSMIVATTAITNFSCPPQQVLAFVKQQKLEIDLSPVMVTLCGEKRTCIYSKGVACLSKGQYVSGVYESTDGTITVGCCQYSPPVQEHQGDDCHEMVMQQTDKESMIASHGSPAAPARMEMTESTSSNPSLLVKAIKKIKATDAKGYTVKVCSPQCGRSTTTTRRQSTTTMHPSTPRHHESPEQKHEQHPGHPKKGLGAHCFSGDMTVSTHSGRKRMDEVRVGDEVLVMSADGKSIYEPIEWLYHRDHHAEADFVSVTTRSQLTLRLSVNHLIPIVPCSMDPESIDMDEVANKQSRFARRLKVGSCIAALSNGKFLADPVVKIVLERKRGIYSPITHSGTIIVNDIFVSCYSSVENHLAQKTVHSILINGRRMLSAIWNRVFDCELGPAEDSNVPKSLQILLKMARMIIPSYV